MNAVEFTSPALTGAVVRLEPLGEHHWPGILAVGQDPDLWQWTIDRGDTPAGLRRWFDTAVTAAAEGRAVPYATILCASGQVVGSSRFGDLDGVNRHVEIGWTWVAPAWQRSAVNTEAKYLMLRHAFEAWRCHRVQLKTDALNTRSRSAMLRIGAREEGVFQRFQVSQGGRVRDTAWFAITDLEWPDVKSRLERRLWEPPTAR
jgi:RimJ/RimL family protein N-acetyltransferase